VDVIKAIGLELVTHLTQVLNTAKWKAFPNTLAAPTFAAFVKSANETLAELVNSTDTNVT